METGDGDSIEICAKCGAKIFADAPVGLCSACLFRTGLGSLDVENSNDDGPGPSEMNFGDYHLLEEIGRGGQGVVYRARQKSLNRMVALKVIGLGRWSSTPELKRFRHEAEAAAGLDHPQIVPIYEIGERDGSCYFSMKFVEGGQLDQVLKREPISPRRAAELLSKIARTVQFAHDHGILHRDIKPGNILLDKNGEPHLTDFGLARLIEQESTVTNSFDVLGTPSYMPPEQAAGHAKELTAAADVYSLGAVLYHMLTGQSPFAGGTTYETIRMVLETEPRNPRLWNPKLNIDLCTICLKCLEKDPAKRYQTAAALADDVERWLRHEPIKARPAGVVRRATKWIQRNPAGAGFAGTLLALILVMAVVLWKSDLFHETLPNGIAVLPFQNLSDDKANAYLADGIQDEILTRLAKVGSLKVIGRSSTQQYASGSRNLSQIARELGVANVIEGSVLKIADRARINVQLVRAKTDEHLWAESYDRKLDDMLSVEGEVATNVAEALQARITKAETQAVQEQPTNNGQAYDAYLHGLAYALRPHAGAYDENTIAAIRHFREATTIDPNFRLAWTWLCRVSALAYFNRMGSDVPHLRDTAQHAVERAKQLQRNGEETLIAEGCFLYYCEKDYDAAFGVFEKARQLQPRSSDTLELLALVSRRRDEWQRSLEYFRQAIEIDPRNLSLLSDYADTLIEMRQYPDALRIFDQLLEINPNDADTVAGKANVLLSQAKLSEAGALLARMPSDPDSDLAVKSRIQQRLYERRFGDAIAIINSSLTRPDRSVSDRLKADYYVQLADLDQFAGNEVGARLLWQQLKDDLESLPGSKLDHGTPASTYQVDLAMADSALGEQEQAQTIVERVMSEPGYKGQLVVGIFADTRARMAMHAGNRDAAIEQLAISARNIGGVDYGDLKLNPLWDPLRNDPRFEEIVASLIPKE